MYKVKSERPALRMRWSASHLSRDFICMAALAFSAYTSVGANDGLWQPVSSSSAGFSSASQSHSDWQEVRPAGGGASADNWLETGVRNTSGEQPASKPDGRPANTSENRIAVSPSADFLTAESQLIEFTGSSLEGEDIGLVGSSAGQLTSGGQITAESAALVDNTAAVNLDLFVGQVTVLGQVDVHRVAVGNGGIIRAQVLDTGELLVIAAAPGSSSLRLWNRDRTQTNYNIRVAETDPETRVPLERMVRMRVRMVEFRKSALGRLGIDWNDSATGPALAAAAETANNSLLRPAVDGLEALVSTSSPVSAYFGIASNITSKINLLAQNGDAVTLAEPVLSAMNGGQASFLAGGEVPYPSVGDNGQTQVEFKEYGVKLNVAPLIDGAGNVRTVIDTEISQLDASVSVQGTPGLLTRRAQTEVTVRSGETIVISGLLSSESGADTDMIPGLGRLPILGRLFSSRSRRNAVNELVIFVTPEVIEPGQPMINAREHLYLNATERRVDTLRSQLPLME